MLDMKAALWKETKAYIKTKGVNFLFISQSLLIIKLLIITQTSVGYSSFKIVVKITYHKIYILKVQFSD